MERPESAILLVEDDPADVLLIRRAFRNAGIGNRLYEVRDGEEAMQYLSGKSAYSDRSKYPFPFLVLLDLRMPKLSGFEVLEWIRAEAHLQELIVVVLTGSESMPDANKAYELGASSYLVKPSNFDRLVELIKRIEGRWLLLDSAPEMAASENSNPTGAPLFPARQVAS